MASSRQDRLAALARAAVDRIFAQARLRLGLVKTPGGKQIVAGVDPEMSLPGLYEEASKEHGAVARVAAVEEVRRSAAGFLEGQREAVKAGVGRVVHHITKRLEGPMGEDDRKELEEAIDSILDRASSAVERVVDAEATAARNLSGADAFSAMGAAAGIDDPRVFFAVTHRNTCGECYRVHTLDGVTPRVWLLSEVSSSYHVRGDDHPSHFGLHPHCQCSMTYLSPGWGFDARGNVKFIAPGHNELARQRGL